MCTFWSVFINSPRHFCSDDSCQHGAWKLNEYGSTETSYSIKSKLSNLHIYVAAIKVTMRPVTSHIYTSRVRRQSCDLSISVTMQYSHLCPALNALINVTYTTDCFHIFLAIFLYDFYRQVTFMTRPSAVHKNDYCMHGHKYAPGHKVYRHTWDVYINVATDRLHGHIYDDYKRTGVQPNS